MKRRSFLLSSVLTLPGARATGLFPRGGLQVPRSWSRADPGVVRETVARAHSSLEGLRDLVDPQPELAKASWDWGFGDWETPLGAASHMGRRDIADYLLSKGARANLFSAAMMGQLSVVQAAVEASPGIQSVPGPHGITLLAHARAGGPEAREVADFLEAAGGADPIPGVEVNRTDLEPLVGNYRYGPEPEEELVVELGANGLSVRGDGTSRRRLVALGGGRFHPVGAPSVEMDLSRPGRLLLRYGGRNIEAIRR